MKPAKELSEQTKLEIEMGRIMTEYHTRQELLSKFSENWIARTGKRIDVAARRMDTLIRVSIPTSAGPVVLEEEYAVFPSEQLIAKLMLVAG